MSAQLDPYVHNYHIQSWSEKVALGVGGIGKSYGLVVMGQDLKYIDGETPQKSNDQENIRFLRIQNGPSRGRQGSQDSKKIFKLLTCDRPIRSGVRPLLRNLTGWNVGSPTYIHWPWRERLGRTDVHETLERFEAYECNTTFVLEDDGYPRFVTEYRVQYRQYSLQQ